MKLTQQEKRRLIIGLVLIVGMIVPMMPTVAKIYGLPDVWASIFSYVGISGDK